MVSPIRGVVLNERQIELRGGAIITLDIHPFHIGANVLVNYDFTRMEPRDIKMACSVYPGASEPEQEDLPVEEGICLEHDEIDAICR